MNLIEHLEALKHDISCLTFEVSKRGVEFVSYEEVCELIDSRISDIEHLEDIQEGMKNRAMGIL